MLRIRGWMVVFSTSVESNEVASLIRSWLLSFELILLSCIMSLDFMLIPVIINSYTQLI